MAAHAALCIGMVPYSRVTWKLFRGCLMFCSIASPQIAIRAAVRLVFGDGRMQRPHAYIEAEAGRMSRSE